VQNLVRHDHQTARPELRLDRAQQQVVEDGQIMPSATPELVQVGADALRALAKRAELKPQLLEGCLDLVCSG
jgi:hypothetical protein